MALELFYTSVPRGLVPGSMGFCTVGYTAGMTSPMIQKLESLSGYRPIFPLGSPEAAKNPEEFAHWRPVIGGYPFSVLSRVRFAGADYSGRLNKFAHHLVLEMSEQVPAGPAWVMMQSGVMAGEWTGEPRILQAGKTIPAGANPLRRCEAWERAAGDAGWAGVLAEAFLLDASKPAYLIYPLGTDVLALLNEAIALLPERQRWNVTFSTYFTNVPANMTCTWRCCVEGTPAAKASPGLATSGVVINLTATRHPPRDSLYVAMARTGEASADAAATGGRRITAPASAGGGWQPAGGAFSTPKDRAKEEIKLLEEEVKAPATALPPLPQRRQYVDPERRRPAGIFWAVAILWPLVLLAGGWLAWQKFGPGQTVPPVPAASPSEKQLAEAKKAAKDSLDRLGQQKTRADTLEKDLQAEKNKTIQERRRADDLAALLETAKARVKELEGTTVASATPIGTRPEDAPKTAPASSGPAPAASAGPAVAKPVPGIPNLYAAEYPKLPITALGSVAKSAPVDLVKNPQAAMIGVKWPDEWSKDWPFRISPQPDESKVVIERAYTDAFGKLKVESLAEASVEGGGLRWQWEAIKDPKNVKPELLEKLVRYAMFRIRDAGGKEIASVQLVVPQEIALIPNGQDAHKLNNPGFDAGRRMQIVDPKGWTVDDKSALGTLVIISPNQTGLTFKLESRSDGVYVTASWSEGKRPQDINKKIAEIDRKLPELKNQLAVLEKDYRTAVTAVENTKRDFHNDPNIKKLEDELRSINAKIEEVKRKLPKNGKGEIEWERKGFEKQIKEWYALPHEERKKLDEGLREQLQIKLGPQPQQEEAAKANRDRKKGELTVQQQERESWVRRKADTESIGGFELRIVVPNSGVVLARIRPVPVNSKE